MKTNLTIYFIFAMAAVLSISGCVQSIDDPYSSSDSDLISIKINSPSSNDSIGYGSIKIDYSVVEYSGVNFIQLFINDNFEKNIVPPSYKTLPDVTLSINSNLVGTRLSFYLIYYDLNGNFCFSDTIKNVLVTANVTPHAPYNLKLLKLSETSFNLSWKDSTKGIVYYEIFRRTSFEEYSDSPYLISGPNSFNINDENLTPGVVYFYKMRGRSNAGKISSFSKEINTTSSSSSSSLPPPTELKANATSPYSVKLTWKNNSLEVNYMIIERRYSFSEFIDVGIVPKSSTSFTDSINGLSPGIEYYYRIKAYSGFDSSWSAEAHVQMPVFLLKAPTITSITNPSNSSVLLKWKDNDPLFTNFHIYRKTEGEAEFMWLAEIADYTGQYEDKTVEPNLKYFYKILATDGTNSSDFSNEVSITTRLRTPVPPAFTIYYYSGSNKIYLAWGFDQTATKFIIERKDVSVVPPETELFEVDGSLRNCYDYVDACGKTFDYRIQAVDDYSASNFSAPVTVMGGCW